MNEQELEIKVNRVKRVRRVKHILSFLLLVGIVLLFMPYRVRTEVSTMVFVGFWICVFVPLIRVVQWKAFWDLEEEVVAKKKEKKSNIVIDNASTEEKEGIEELYSSVRKLKRSKNERLVREIGFRFYGMQPMTKEEYPVAMRRMHHLIKGFPVFVFYVSGAATLFATTEDHVSKNVTPLIIVVGIVMIFIVVMLKSREYKWVYAVLIAASIGLYLSGGALWINKEFDTSKPYVTTPVLLYVEGLEGITRESPVPRIFYYATILDLENEEITRLIVSGSTYFDNRENEMQGKFQQYGLGVLEMIKEGEISLNRVIMVERRGALGIGSRYIPSRFRVYRYIDYVDEPCEFIHSE